MIEKKCPICHTNFMREENEHWKRICYDCWKNYRYAKRIQRGFHHYDIYVCHPSVTKEELDEYIKKNKLERGWGVQEYDKTKFKIWLNYIWYD